MKTLPFLLFFIVLNSILCAQTLSGIESAEYDPINHRFLVSNGSGVMEVDASGNAIGVIGGGTPQADYGMEIIGNTLFSVVGSTVKAYQLDSGSLISSVSIVGAGFLNGLACDGVNRVWVTDFSNAKIMEIDYGGEYICYSQGAFMTDNDG